MLVKIFLFLIGLSPDFKRTLWRWWYQVLANQYQKPDWSFMNYGFVPLQPEISNLDLAESDENNRYFIQLYHHVATPANVEGKKVLEVGSGRGGGAAYIARYLKPEKMIGVDFSANNIKVASKIHQLPNLSFQQGDAEALPFEDNVFDVVVNVESSHCYGSMEKFIQEVSRVLKTGGIFSWADLRLIDEVAAVDQSFKESGLTPIKTSNITPNVLEALALINEQKQTIIETHIPHFLKDTFQEFGAVKDSQLYEGFQTGKIVYLSYVFQK